MSHISFVADLKQYNGRLPAHIQEEFLNLEGTLDTVYLASVQKEPITEAKFRGLVNSELGTIRFEKEKHENQVTPEIFNEHYSFGTYPNVRGWIGYFARVLDLVLTRDALYDYLTPRA
jgi:hypothetical protein